MMRKAFPLAPLLLLAACHGRNSEPKVTEAWVRLPAVSGQPAAAYFTIHGGRRDAKLMRMESALAAKTEMHASMKGMHGMATMAPSPKSTSRRAARSSSGQAATMRC